ncbi:hypothetical protein H6F86_20835 [Phormidium sp. FACHB-592]|uniref:Uncharacterized protein n=1 Tax=Stenomitos frigidus AS-A4 TaxID=2933935 RepID=A0ABV0KEP1_9CYAN|nr:hypothetical protein [Phormidium sp. FACHB-592]MBD2076280.1 hypothetical protein [Phormidium sp. FACHB-592]
MPTQNVMTEETPPDRTSREPRQVTQYEQAENREQTQARFRQVSMERFDGLRYDVNNLAIASQQRQSRMDDRLRSISGWQIVILALQVVSLGVMLFWRQG